jgi:magnesium-transporting ATPase (P-type)
MTSWGWPALFLLGAYHGINPGMGWLFAVARGMQEHATKAVARALIPITLGHALSIGLVVALAGLIQIVLPLGYVQIVVAIALISLGAFRLLRRKHFAWGGMQVGFRDLTFWSFLMASAHGAGLMVLPIVLHTASSNATNAMPAGHEHHMDMDAGAGAWTGIAATLVHTLGYLSVTAMIALLVYRKFGLSLLRKGWFNLDLVWAVALIVTGCVALVV